MRRLGGKRSATLLAALVGLMICYLTVPWEFFEPYTQALPGQAINNMQANPLSRLIKLALLGISVALLFARHSLSRPLLRQTNIFFRIFLCLVPLSAVWSISRGDTLARFVSILATVSVCLAFCAGAWHRQRFQNVLRPVMTLLLFGSVFFGVIDQDLVIEHGEGTLKNAWHGLTSQKNSFGQLASFGLILWLHAGLANQVKPWRALLGSALGFACVLLSRSSTSLMAALFACMFVITALRSPPALRRYMPYLITLFAVAVLTYALAVLDVIPGSKVLLEPIAALTGKDTTFSARSEIWRIIKEHIALSPLLGSGYGAYWTGPVPTSPSYAFLWQMYFYPNQSHNGYLEIVNDLGYVGLIVLIGYLVTYIRQGIKLMKVDRAQGVLLLALFFQQAIENLSESSWLVINSGFIFAVMVLATFSLARGLIEHSPQKGLRRATVPAHSARNGLPRRIGASAQSPSV